MVTMEGTEGSTEQASVCIIPALLEEEDEKRDASKGTKLSPVCIDADMKQQATPTDELREQCFPETFSLIEAQFEIVPPGVTSASFSSHSSSTGMSKHNMYTSEDDTDGILTQLMKKSAAINSTVTDRTVSRHGRSSQRWIVDSQSTKVTRLVTGCVPILNGGKIMLVSASKKNEWILPKGGWETDEEMEESAIRETFEEAGVIGILGPRLSQIQYETRKARKRRLALEEQLKGKPEAVGGQFCSGWSDVSQLSEDDHISAEKDETLSDKAAVKAEQVSQSKTKHKPASLANELAVGGNGLQDKNAGRTTRADSPKNQDDTGGQVNGESTRVYSHVSIILFPLFVKEVMAKWPESGRLRKMVDLQEAIELLSARPEMQSILLEVKARGLHRV